MENLLCFYDQCYQEGIHMPKALVPRLHYVSVLTEHGLAEGYT